MKIYDCFTYYNEDLILKLRLETLWDYVDFFVICEANFTHSGNNKQFSFDPDKFYKYSSKIRYLRMAGKPEGWKSSWDLENAQRNYLINGLFDAEGDDWIMVSDIDEIPNPKKIASFSPKFIRGDFEQMYLSYYFNNLWLGEAGGSNKWCGTKITTYENLANFFKNVNSVRNFKSSGVFRSVRRWFFKKVNVQVIPNGGWHFTWILSLKDIVKKIKATAHTELDIPKFNDVEYISERISQGYDFHKQNSRYKRVELTHDMFPKYLVDNQVEYQEFIL
jgi:beta-1,4-mannosyl-glycoprotein beta-1,4-N-acetylglucosaminyltransferase